MPDQGNVPDVNILVIVSLVLAVLIIAGAIALGARRARLGIFLLSVLAIVLLGVADVLGRQAVLAILHEVILRIGGQIDVGTAQGIRAAVVLVQVAPFAIGAAWVLGLLVTARGQQWGWFAVILIFPLITPLLEQLLNIVYVQTSGQVICADIVNLCGFVPLAKQLPFIVVPLLTPLVTLIYGIAGPQEKPDVSASNTATDTAT